MADQVPNLIDFDDAVDFSGGLHLPSSASATQAPSPPRPAASTPPFPRRTPPSHWPPPPGPHHSNSLPEFVGPAPPPLFLPPSRSAVDTSRPVPVEFRPRPPRESQSGCAVRSIAASSSRLWAAGDSGLRFFSLSLNEDTVSSRSVRRGDEESAPFRESRRTTPVTCLLVDTVRGGDYVWSGHSDGRISGWWVETSQDSMAGREFEEFVAWDAHRGPVLSIVVSPYGELWSGSEGGVVKVWSKEAIDKSLSARPDEKHKASVLIARSFIDLRSLTIVGGECPLPTVDIKLLLSDDSRSKVWGGGYLSFILWNSRTKELLKVINVDGQVEIHFDGLSLQDTREEYAKIDKKGPTSFFQRSRNALVGAAEAFRKVATKAAFGDDIRKVEALTMSTDGMIWSGSANGSLARWDGNGCHLQEFQFHSSSILCICSFGTRLWIGYKDGMLQVIDLEGKLLGGWVAHSKPIVNMSIGGSYVFTLASHGGIRGWNLLSPGPLDDIMRAELTKNETSYKNFEYVKILVGSWNVGQERASYHSLKAWLEFATLEVGIVVVGLQEIEMGAGYLAVATAKETVGLEGSTNGEWWMDSISNVLSRASFERVGSRQLAGLLLAVWARRDVRKYIGDVDSAAVACGFGRAIGNKGAVALRMRLHGRTISFLNCHFAAHMEAVGKRNEDFDHVYQTLSFSSASAGIFGSTSGGFSAVQYFRGSNVSVSRKPELSESDMVIFLGDFNYRLYNISFEETLRLVSKRSFDLLGERDQLRSEMKAGRVFQGLREALIYFPPTYKFDKHVPGPAAYDSSEKQRIPAWCDRILYRDSRSSPEAQCSLDCPVVSSISTYQSCMDANDSDHKPIKCVFNVDVAYVDNISMRKQLSATLCLNKEIRCFIQERQALLQFFVSSNEVILKDHEPVFLRIANQSTKEAAAFCIVGEDLSSACKHEPTLGLQGRRSYGFPSWLLVTPAVGIIHPQQAVEVSLQQVELSRRHCLPGMPTSFDSSEKLARLMLNVTGSHSTEATSYRIQIIHHQQRMVSS